MKKILLLSANPFSTSRLRLDKELRAIEESLRLPIERGEFSIKSLLATRVKDLHRALLQVQPQIVHFSGHGEGEAGLCLESRDGQAQLVDSQDLAALFALLKPPVECVLLNACYSETQAKALQSYTDYVIGMNQAIGDETAIDFAEAFYEILSSEPEYDYRRSFELTLNRLKMEGIAEHNIPVLLSRAQADDPSPESKNHPLAVAHGMSRDQVFISYSRKDAAWLDKVRTNLKFLEDKGKLRFWDDTKIPPGALWRDEIKIALASAKVALFLVSADFLASDYISQEELPVLLEAAETEGTHILSLILRPCLFDFSELEKFQTVNPPSKPLSSMDTTEQEATLVELSKVVYRLLSE